MLEIVTGHKAFQIRSPISAEVDQWHLRLQEVIMLQEKVANVAHGWLLKEEGGGGSGGGSQLKHFWFVLFSNGILMFFTDPNRAVLGQACPLTTHRPLMPPLDRPRPCTPGAGLHPGGAMHRNVTLGKTAHAASQVLLLAVASRDQLEGEHAAVGSVASRGPTLEESRAAGG